MTIPARPGFRFPRPEAKHPSEPEPVLELPDVLQSTPGTSLSLKNGVSRNFVLSAVFLAVAATLLGLPLLNYAVASMTPPTFLYVNVPFRVCDPVLMTAPPRVEKCLPPERPYVPGEVVPVIVERQTRALLWRTAELLAYTVDRNLVNIASEARVILPVLASTVPSNGYERSVSVAHALPITLVPGRYYLEGVATVYGPFGISTAYFRTEEFDVALQDVFLQRWRATSNAIPYNSEHAIPTYWRAHPELGSPLGPEITFEDGTAAQAFSGGVVTWHPETGVEAVVR